MLVLIFLPFFSIKIGFIFSSSIVGFFVSYVVDGYVLICITP